MNEIKIPYENFLKTFLFAYLCGLFIFVDVNLDKDNIVHLRRELFNFWKCL